MIANPTNGPIVVATGTGATLPVGTYRVAYAWRSPSGSTQASPTTSVVVAAGQSIVVTLPALPLDAVSTDIYISLAAGSTVLGWATNTTSLTASIGTLPLPNAVLVPTANTTDNPPPYVQGETETTIRNRMLQNLVQLIPGIDTAQGSFIWDLVDIPAIELALVAARNNRTVDLGFIATTKGQYLDFKASEHGISRVRPTPATGLLHFIGVAGTTIPVGTQIATASAAGLPSQVYTTTQTGIVGPGGTVDVTASALTGGTAGNAPTGTVVIPTPRVAGVTSVTNLSPFTGGLDMETDSSLQTRTLRAVQTPSAGGNLADYINWTLGVAGVGGVSVVPVRDGPGTVSVAIIDASKNPAPQTLIDAVQTLLAPPFIIQSQTNTPGAFVLEGSGSIIDSSRTDLSAPSARLSYNVAGIPTVAPTLASGFTTPQIANPTAAPTAVAGAGSTSLLAGTYTIGYTWRDAYGATQLSPTVNVTITAGQQINVTLPALPGNATSTDVYMSIAAGSATLGFIVNTLGVTLSITALPIGGAANPPIANSTGIPTTLLAGTYTVGYAWRNSSGSTPMSPTSTVTITVGQTISVTLPGFPGGVTGADVYLSIAAGSTTLGFDVTTNTNAATLTALPATAAANPPSNFARVRQIIGSPSKPFILPQAGIWQARVAVVADQAIGTIPFFEIGVYSTSSNNWAVTRPGGSVNAVTAYTAAQMPTAERELIQEFYWNGVDYLELRITRKAAATLANPGSAPTLATAVMPALVGNPVIPPTLTSSPTPPLIGNPSLAPILSAAPTNPLVANPTSAPGLATSATGGTLLAGIYTVAYAWYNTNGETMLSPTASITTTGSTSTITGTLPALGPGATAANVYVSGPGGSTLLRSNGSGVSGTSYTISAPASGASAPTLNNTGTPTSLTTGNYTFAYAYRNSNGSTLISPTALVGVTTGQQITVNIPSIPVGVTSTDIYMSTAVNGTTLALSVNIATSSAVISALPAGAAIPIANTTNAASSLAGGTFLVAYAWRNLNGTTLASPNASITITAGQQINVSLPALPLGAISTDVYMSTTTGGAVLGLSQNTTTTTAALIALPVGGAAAIPAANTTGASSLPAGTYLVAYAWRNDSGITLLSPTASVTLPLGQYISVTLPALPANALSTDVYLSTAPGGATLAFDANTTATTIGLIALPASNAAGAPASNLTVPETTRVVWVDYVKFRSEFSQYSGGGKAPVGARVTVEAGGTVTVNISATIIIAVGYDVSLTRAAVTSNIVAYLQSIAYQADNTVRFARVGTAILNTPGVLDYQNLLLNNAPTNVPVGVQQVALLGTTTYS